MIDTVAKATPGEWASACDSYGKVQHSRKYDCVYTVVPGETGVGERLVTVASRVENHNDAKLLRAAKQLYSALKWMNPSTKVGASAH